MENEKKKEKPEIDIHILNQLSHAPPLSIATSIKQLPDSVGDLTNNLSGSQLLAYQQFAPSEEFSHLPVLGPYEFFNREIYQG